MNDYKQTLKKYITVVYIMDNKAYYTVTQNTKSNNEHSKLLYKYLKAFAYGETNAFILRAYTVSEAVTELSMYLETQKVTEIHRRRLPHKTEDFALWLLTKDKEC